jgi:hypothetical protein
MVVKILAKQPVVLKRFSFGVLLRGIRPRRKMQACSIEERPIEGSYLSNLAYQYRIVTECVVERIARLISEI